MFFWFSRCISVARSNPCLLHLIMIKYIFYFNRSVLSLSHTSVPTSSSSKCDRRDAETHVNMALLFICRQHNFCKIIIVNYNLWSYRMKQRVYICGDLQSPAHVHHNIINQRLCWVALWFDYECLCFLVWFTIKCAVRIDWAIVYRD